MIWTAIFVLMLIVGFAYMLNVNAHKLPHYCEDCGRNLDDIPMGINTGCELCDPARCANFSDDVTKGF